MTNRPEVILIAAMSIDGFIAPFDKESLPSTAWTSKEDKDFFSQKSKEIGLIIMGSKTFETIGKALPDRVSIVMTSQPEKYAEYKDPDLLFTNETPVEILENLAKQGIEQVALCGGSSIYSLFLEKDLVDRMLLTVEPFVFGDGVKLFHGKIEQEFSLLKQNRLNEKGTLLLEYEA